MSAPPRISVIVPCKDGAPFLPTTFRSLSAQTVDPSSFEMIFVDDGSTDDTPAVLDEWAPRFDRFEVIRNEVPTGLANARNAGLDAASGETIVFLDGDDWLPAGQLEAVAEGLSALDVDFVRCDHMPVHGGSRQYRRAPMAVRGRALDPRAGILPTYESTMVDYPYAWAGAFHRRLLDAGLLHFPADFHTAEDRSWIWRLHLRAESFAVVDAPGICYRRGVAGSLTQIYDARQLDFARAFADIFALLDGDRDASRFWPKAARNWLAILHHHVGRLELMDSDVRRRFSEVTRATSSLIPDEALDAVLLQSTPARVRAVVPYLPHPFARILEATR